LSASSSATTLFLQEVPLYPQQIGAIFPSSKNLASVMANWLPANPDAFVLELGPGTAVVTQTLLERGLRQDRLVAIEKSARLANLVRQRFPHAQIITGDACNLDKLLRENAREIDSVAAVISSLPLRIFSAEAAAALARKVRSILQPEAKWVQYSYYLGSSHSQATSHFRLLASDVVWWNLPPARISVYQKQPLR
jgi:phosphatidylethanolamine/phosphatidyl-N-methylethanolamine N-methyltransferase